MPLIVEIDTKSTLLTDMPIISAPSAEVHQLITDNVEVNQEWVAQQNILGENETQTWITAPVSFIDSMNDSLDSLIKREKDIFASSQQSVEETLFVNPINITSYQDQRMGGILFNDSHHSINGDSSSYLTAASPMLIYLLTTAPILLLLWMLLRSWWLFQNLQSANDPSSKLSQLPLPPGDFGLPIVGETLSWMLQGTKFNSSRRKKFGCVFKTNTLGSPTVRVSGQKYVKEILKGEHENIETVWPDNMRKLLGENALINSMGPVHKLKRKVACKAFSTSSLNRYIPVLRKNAKRNIQSLSKCERPMVYKKMQQLTFELAASSLIGLDTATSGCKKIVLPFYEFVSNIFCVPLKIPGLGFCKAMNARARILDLLDDHIQKKKSALMREVEEGLNNEVKENAAFDIIFRELFSKSIKQQKEKGDDCMNNNVHKEILDQEKDEPISNIALKEIAIELLSAGYSPTASAMTSVVMELTQNPHVFKKVEDELLEHGLLKKETSLNEEDVEINLHLINRLTYLEQVFKETCRKHPPILGGYRKARKTFQLGDYRIPKGWTIVYNIRDTSEYEYDDANVFDPERFSSKSSNGDECKYLAFGGGPRMCIGQQLARLMVKICIIELFRTFKSWNLANKEVPKMKTIPMLHPADGLPCHFQPRETYGVLN